MAAHCTCNFNPLLSYLHLLCHCTMRNYTKKSMEHLILLNSAALDTTGLNTCMIGYFIWLFYRIYQLHRPYSIITNNKSVRMRMEVLMVYFRELMSIFRRRFKKIIKNVSQDSCCPDWDFSLALFNTKQGC